MRCLTLLSVDDVKVKIKKVDPSSPDSEILRQAAGLVSEGRVIVCPTDTGYAFTASGLAPKAIVRLFMLKGRSYTNPVHAAVHSIGAAEKYAHVSKVARYLARRFLPGALTLVLPKKDIIPSLLVAGGETIGIRIPDNKIILELAAMTDLPLTATSANTSGQPTTYSVDEIIMQMGEAMKGIALVLDQGVLPGPHELSTIVDLCTDPPQLIRQG